MFYAHPTDLLISFSTASMYSQIGEIPLGLLQWDSGLKG